MKNINLINPISPQKQQEINRWLCITLALSCITCITLIGYTGYQLKQYYNLKAQKNILEQQTAAFDTTTNELAKLKKEQQNLQNRIEKVTTAAKTSDTLSAQLQEISRVIPKDVYLESFIVSENEHIQMSGYGLKTESINNFLSSLNQSALFKTMHLALLQTHKVSAPHQLPFYFKLAQTPSKHGPNS